ncbi:hypothetical protein [Bradyrhizobium diazoefficiens]
MHLLAQKHRKQIRGDVARSSPNQSGPATGGPATCCIGSSDNADAVPRGYGIDHVPDGEPGMDAVESELGHR